MAEAATNPIEGVGEVSDVQKRMVSFFARANEPAKKPAAEPEPEVPEATAEAVEPEGDATDQAEPEAVEETEPEVEEAPEPSVADEFEIVHNGQQHKLTRAEIIEHAQKGFDYTQKTQALAQKESLITEALAAAQQVAQMQIALAPEISQVEGFKSQIQQYDGVNWIALAQQDPSLYAQHRANYDMLRDGLQRAENVLNQKFRTVHEGQQKATEAIKQSEVSRLFEYFPQWKDETKRTAEQNAIWKAAMADGYTAEELSQIPQAKYVRTLWKAAQYDKQQAAMGASLKKVRTAPPMAKPGAAQPAQASGAAQEAKLRAQLKKTGDPRAAAALYTLLEKRKGTK